MPGATITGTQNINVWFNYITIKRKTADWFSYRVYYMFKWKQNYNAPPFHGCFVKWAKKMNPESNIDILLATYNGEKYLTQQIDSILAQTCKDFRLLIRDDLSADNTISIVKNLHFQIS